MKQFVPINDQISVLPDRDQKCTPGGIVLTNAAQGATEEGVVLNVGCGHLTNTGARVPLRVKSGDRVVYRRQGGLELDCCERKIVVISEAAVVGLTA
jgi:chaperonin GroES